MGNSTPGKNQWKALKDFVATHEPDVQLSENAERVLDRMLYTAHGNCRISESVDLDAALMIYRMVSAAIKAPDDAQTKEAMRNIRM